MTSQEFLKSIGACQAGIDSLGDRRLQDSILTSPRGDWWYWVASMQVGKTGWPGKPQLIQSLMDCAGHLGAADEVRQWLREASYTASRERLTVLFRKTIDVISGEPKLSTDRSARLAFVADVFRQTLCPIPFLETLDK